MTPVWGRGLLHQERFSVAISVPLSDFSLPPELGDKLFDQPARPSGTKPSIAVASVVATNIPKYSEVDL